MSTLLSIRVKSDNRPHSKVYFDDDNESCSMLLDTGSEISAVSWNWFLHLTKRPKLRQTLGRITTAAGQDLKVMGVWDTACSILGKKVPGEIYVIKGLSQPGIIGVDVLHKADISLSGSTLPQLAVVTKRHVIQPGHTKIISCQNHLNYSGPVLFRNDLSEQDELYEIEKGEKIKVAVTNWGINVLEICRQDQIGMLTTIPPQAIQ